MNRGRKYVAEIIGTFALVTFGCGTACAVGCDSVSGSGYLLTALAFGLVLMVMCYCIGNISGCHVNPAVSIAMLIRGNIDVVDFIGYVISQLIGALGGCLVLLIFFGRNCGFGANQVQDTWANGGIGKALIVEIVLTFIFVLVVIGATSKASNAAIAGVAIGFALALVHILGIALTGTSVNPARSLLPAIFALLSKNNVPMHQVWIFIVGPLVGGILAALVYSALESKDDKKKPETASEAEQVKAEAQAEA